MRASLGSQYYNMCIMFLMEMQYLFSAINMIITFLIKSIDVQEVTYFALPTKCLKIWYMLLKWMEHISADILKLIGWTKIYDVLLDLVTCMWYCFKHEIRIDKYCIITCIVRIIC